MDDAKKKKRTTTAGAARAEAIEPSGGTGLTIPRHFTTPGADPFDTVEWEIRDATIANEKGENVFEQNDVDLFEQCVSCPVHVEFGRIVVGDFLPVLEYQIP